MDRNLSEFLTHFDKIRNTKELKDLSLFLARNLFYAYFISCAFIACSSDCLKTFLELGNDILLDVDGIDTITSCGDEKDKGINLKELSERINYFRGKEIRFNEK